MRYTQRAQGRVPGTENTRGTGSERQSDRFAAPGNVPGEREAPGAVPERQPVDRDQGGPVSGAAAPPNAGTATLSDQTGASGRFSAPGLVGIVEPER